MLLCQVMNMAKKIIIVICIAAIVISAGIFILGYNMENNQEEPGTMVTSDNATKGKEINVFLSDGVGVSDTP